MAKPPTTAEELLQGWDRRAQKAIDAHYESGRRFARRNAQLGIPSVVLAAAIATLAFATVGRTVSIGIQITIGFLASIQVVLSSLHTWLRHAELAEKHRQAGARYAAIRRHIEQVRVLGATDPTTLAAAITDIRDGIDDLGRESPSIPADIWSRTQQAFKGHGTADGKILSPDIQPNA